MPWYKKASHLHINKRHVTKHPRPTAVFKGVSPSPFRKRLKRRFESDANQIASGKKVLASVPNLNVLLNDVLFMEVLQPSTIRYTYKIRPAKNFGTSFSRKYNSIELAVAEPYHGCTHLINKHFVDGRIVLIQRGECSFVTKAIHAEEAGAVAVVITDNNINNDQSFIDMVDDNTERVVSIPATFLLGKDGHIIKSTLDRLGEPYAVITIPINVTGVNVYSVNQPPWTLW